MMESNCAGPCTVCDRHMATEIGGRCHHCIHAGKHRFVMGDPIPLRMLPNGDVVSWLALPEPPPLPIVVVKDVDRQLGSITLGETNEGSMSDTNNLYYLAYKMEPFVSERRTGVAETHEPGWYAMADGLVRDSAGRLEMYGFALSGPYDSKQDAARALADLEPKPRSSTR